MKRLPLACRVTVWDTESGSIGRIAIVADVGSHGSLRAACWRSRHRSSAWTLSRPPFALSVVPKARSRRGRIGIRVVFRLRGASLRYAQHERLKDLAKKPARLSRMSDNGNLISNAGTDGAYLEAIPRYRSHQCLHEKHTVRATRHARHRNRRRFRSRHDAGRCAYAPAIRTVARRRLGRAGRIARQPRRQSCVSIRSRKSRWASISTPTTCARSARA